MTSRSALRCAAPLLVLCAGLAAATGLADDAAKEPPKVELKLTAKPGDVFHFRLTRRIAESRKLPELNVDTTIDIAHTMTFTVGAARPDGLTDVQVALGDVKGTFESSVFGTFEVDSTKHDEPEPDDDAGIGATMKNLTLLAGKTYRVVFDARGKVVEVHGMKEILGQVLKDNPSFTAQQVAALVDDESIRQQMQAQFAMFSDGPVAVGGKWTVDSPVAAPVPTKVVTEYTLVSADDAKAVVKSKTRFVSAADGAIEMPGPAVDGAFTVSRADGLILNSVSRSRMLAEITPDGATEGGDARKVRVEVTSTATMERVSADDVKPAAKKEPPPATPPAPK